MRRNPVLCGMKVAVIRDTPRCAFVLIVNGERVGEFLSEVDAWQFAEDAFGVAQSARMKDAGEVNG